MVKIEGVLSVDLGTQSIRAALYNLKGQLLSLATEGYKTYYPAPGLAEQNPEDWWEALKLAVQKLTRECPMVSVVAIAASATSSTVLPVDCEGNPLTKAILWMDTRASKQARRISETLHPLLEWCGGTVSPEWFWPKLLWIKEERPEVYSEAYHIVEALDWLNYKLTGRWVSSQCNASCKWNYLSDKGWSNDFFEEIGVPEFMVKIPSEVLPMGTVIGKLQKETALDLKCKDGIPVVQGGIDAHASVVGLGNFEEGETSLVLGSSSVILINTSFCSPISGFWGPYKEPLWKGFNLLEAGQTSSGSIMNWFIERIAKHYISEADKRNLSPFDLLDAEAFKVPPGSQGVVVLDHWQGNRTPYKDPDSRGVVYGLTLSHEASHVGRAIYEGISFGIRLLLDYLKEEGIYTTCIKACGGGTKSGLWMQILADVCEQPLDVTVENMTLLGNAIVGATGVGIFSSFAEGFEIMQPNFTRVNSKTSFSVYQENYERYCRLYPLAKGLREI
ncbi:MAG: hypothetical protein PWP57_580 [Candidatus Atribacteria bacterium]|nr:hypothetical protein [Candidatus Atribacteria bacterium]